jgi:xylulokinase
MSLLGIDVGTTGCKAAAFDLQGRVLGAAYREFAVRSARPGWAELDPGEIWSLVQDCVREAIVPTGGDPVTALSVSSLGEASVPVSRDRRILGPSILNFDPRGADYVEPLRSTVSDDELYALNGNTHGNHYGLTKIMWLRDHRPELYAEADRFLLWSGFIEFMLGAEPRIDYSLACRTLLFDLDREAWSTRVAEAAGIDLAKLPPPVPSGTVVGAVSDAVAADLGLPKGVAVVSGAHDQCANAVGCGVVGPGAAMYGMGTFTCIVPVFSSRPDTRAMPAHGLNTEHHAVPGRFVTFIYNQGGSILKWCRDTFANLDHARAREAGRDVYDDLLREMPQGPSGVIVLPHFTTTGPPEFIADSCGMIAGLRLDTTRGRILKGALEGTTFYLREIVDALPSVGLEVDEYTAVGGGAKSEAWVHLAASIFGKPFRIPEVTEAGALGAALMAGVGTGVYASYSDAVSAAVRIDRTIEPDMDEHARYAPLYRCYRETKPHFREYLRVLAAQA